MRGDTSAFTFTFVVPAGVCVLMRNYQLLPTYLPSFVAFFFV